MIELPNRPFSLIIQDNLLYAIDGNNDKIEMPDDSLGANFCGEWLSNYLPSPSFDVLQSGNIRKAEEAECIYCVLVVKAALRNVEFDNDFTDIVEH